MAALGASNTLLEITMMNPCLLYFILAIVAIYALARISLQVVLSLRALRALPYSAYAMASWSIYVPHFA